MSTTEAQQFKAWAEHATHLDYPGDSLWAITTVREKSMMLKAWRAAPGAHLAPTAQPVAEVRGHAENFGQIKPELFWFDQHDILPIGAKLYAARDAQADTAIIRAARNIQHSLFHDGPGDAVLALRDQLLPLLAGALEDCGYLPDLQRAARDAGLSEDEAAAVEFYTLNPSAALYDFDKRRAAAQEKRNGSL